MSGRSTVADRESWVSVGLPGVGWMLVAEGVEAIDTGRMPAVKHFWRRQGGHVVRERVSTLHDPPWVQTRGSLLLRRKNSLQEAHERAP